MKLIQTNAQISNIPTHLCSKHQWTALPQIKRNFSWGKIPYQQQPILVGKDVCLSNFGTYRRCPKYFLPTFKSNTFHRWDRFTMKKFPTNSDNLIIFLGQLLWLHLSCQDVWKSSAIWIASLTLYRNPYTSRVFILSCHQ
jgi:hypothetical protein